MAYMELVENYENLVKSMVPMECMEPVISGVWDTTITRISQGAKECPDLKMLLIFLKV